MKFVIKRKNDRTMTTFKRILSKNKKIRFVIVIFLIFRIEIIKNILIIKINEMIIFLKVSHKNFFESFSSTT